jgi:protein-L-isoaspartate(D-aspartate) O-methyltransferase
MSTSNGATRPDDYVTARHAMVRDQLEARGITDVHVLQAMRDVPRHLFVAPEWYSEAYSDRPLPIGAGQTISQPYTVAFQTELLGNIKGVKVLEIGTGSGYQTSVLCEMGAKVFSIERQKELFVNASARLGNMGYSPKLKYGDGYEGWPAFAPFDRILVTCGASDVPKNLVEQLAPGGLMVVPVDSDSGQEMLLLRKDQNGETSVENHGAFRFVPMLKERAR